MEQHEKLLNVLQTFIDTFGGDRRLRDIKMLLLIHQATAAGTGITASDLSRQGGAPLESTRRQLQRHVDAGYLRTTTDPNDRRAIRCFATEKSSEIWRAEQIVEFLGERFGFDSTTKPQQTVPLDELLALIDIFIEGYMGSIRIRGAKMALLVYKATLQSTGVTISDLARLNEAPMETVRRILAQHVEMGHILFVEDPADDRKIRVVSANPDLERARLAEMNRRLEQIDWARLGVLQP